MGALQIHKVPLYSGLPVTSFTPVISTTTAVLITLNVSLPSHLQNLPIRGLLFVCRCLNSTCLKPSTEIDPRLLIFIVIMWFLSLLIIGVDIASCMNYCKSTRASLQLRSLSTAHSPVCPTHLDLQQDFSSLSPTFMVSFHRTTTVRGSLWSTQWRPSSFTQ